MDYPPNMTPVFGGHQFLYGGGLPTGSCTACIYDDPDLTDYRHVESLLRVRLTFLHRNEVLLVDIVACYFIVVIAPYFYLVYPD